MKQKVVLLIAGVMGFTAFLLTHVYLQRERQAIFRDARQVSVVVALRDLPAGEELTRDNTTTRLMFENQLDRRVFRGDDRDVVLGRTLRYGITANTPITWFHVGVDLDDAANLAPAISSGMRAISIPVSAETAVSNLVRPNDRVDILGTFSLTDPTNPAELESVTLTVLQNVTVLATGQDLGRTEIEIVGGGRRRGGYNTVTIAVFPQEAEVLAFAMHARGQLTLTLRNPTDVSMMRESRRINFDALEQELPRLNQSRQRLHGTTGSDLLGR